MIVTVGIATAGRRAQLTRTLNHLKNQSRPPERILICPADPADYDSAADDGRGAPIELVWGRRGSCAQRNAIIDAAHDADVMIFFDDDFYPAHDYVERVERLFQKQPTVALATHWPILDGASSAGIRHEDALQALEASQAIVGDSIVTPTYGGYGCNMSVRMSVLRSHGLRFDEHLPLYGWLEDLDLSRRMARYGRVVSDPSLRGVHLGTKSGKSSGLRLGYSQIANPIYMIRKGSMTHRYGLKQLARNVSANVARSIQPEEWVDRRGRLKGNIIAFKDLLSGRLDPERILEM